VVWHKDKDVSGTSILFGGERSVMITDLDEDGNLELINIWDSFHPDSTALDGFDALEIYEHDPASGDFLPDTPTLTYDPPRDARGRIALEFMSVATDVDGDGVMELILTYRDGNGLILSIISLPSKDFDNPDWTVEYVDSTVTTPSDVEHGWKVHSMTVGDLDGDGKMNMLVQIDGDDMPIIVYTATAPNTYEKVVFDNTMYHADYHGSAAKLVMADINGDGNTEVYLGARGGNIWVVSGITDIATAFNAANFTLIADVPEFEGRATEGVELRGGEFDDADNNGKMEFLVTARDPYEAIYGIEWIGGTGDVTDSDNHQMFTLYQADTTDAITTGFVAMAVGDYDGDGDTHLDIVFVTGNGNEGAAPGIFLVEFDATGLAVAASGSTPEAFSLHQNYPNPFNPVTRIVYDIHEAGDVRLVVYNILGQEVRTLLNGQKSTGRHEALWDGKDHDGKSMTSGVYFYSLESAGFRETRKMLLLK
ncbi:MAG: T9SS type A sorting domain-containing protein, partial [Candidatus Marinimicrobia bacterium]|nr:T9SS type A sorting domain-containing protein [Candidatus Neomarinimicrobiota bacterium]